MSLIPLLVTSLIGFQMKPMPPAALVPMYMKDVAGVARVVPSKTRSTVLFFVATDCPIANRMAPELSRIVRDFQPHGFDFVYIYVDPTQTPKQIQSHLKEFKLGAPGILDSKHMIVGETGATVTPQAVVLDKTGTMLYRGRINDLFLEHGRARRAAKRDDLRIALKELQAGKPVSVPQTPALGCSIPNF